MEASAKLMVSITEVVETNRGSPMSAFAIDFLRSVPVFTVGAGTGPLGMMVGVPGFETGGVLLVENGGTGEPCGRKAFMPGLGPPGEGRGETGRPGEN